MKWPRPLFVSQMTCLTPLKEAEEKHCVDECIRGIIEASPTGKFLTDSHFYIQYLRVAVLISLKKEGVFIESELMVLQENGYQKDLEYTDVLCEFLMKRLKSEMS